MVKKSFFMFMLVAMAAVFCTSAQADVWADKSSGFSIEAANGWVFFKNDMFNIELTLDRDVPGYPFVMIDVKARKKGQDLEKVVQDYLVEDFLNQQAARNLKASADEEYDPVCEGVQAYQAFYTILNMQNMDIRHFFFVKKNVFAVITIMNKKDEYPLYQKQIKSLLASFKVDGATPKFKGL
jgi:hypothetical protein